jgi:hypothetical protein
LDRIEPVFLDHVGNREPIIDVHAEAELKRRILYRRVDSSVAKMTSPIGRNATQVDVWFGKYHLDQMKQRHIEDAAITDALAQLGLGRRTTSQLGHGSKCW